jgi:hypothetical protein
MTLCPSMNISVKKKPSRKERAQSILQKPPGY